MISAFLSTLLWAQEPVSPELRIQVSDDATVYVLPRVRQNMAEIVIRDCDCDLAGKYQSIHTEKIKMIVPQASGRDSWTLRIFFYDDFYQVDATANRGYLDIWVREDTDAREIIPPFESFYSIEEFLDSNEEDIDDIYPPDLNIRFLFGEALSLRSRFDDRMLSTCEPREELETIPFATLQKQYIAARSNNEIIEQGDTAYAMGWYYFNQELYDEAAYYFEQLSNRAGRKSPLCIAMVNAHIALYRNEWEQYREHVRIAYKFGAEDLQVIGSLAYLSHEKGYPSRRKIGHAIANLTADPAFQLLAAELLQMSGYYAESLQLLIPLYEQGAFLEDPEKDAQTALRYGDALMVTGDTEKAKIVWRGVPQELGMMRYTLAILNESGNDYWPKLIPFLYRIANNTSSEQSARAEAMYLISQIDTIKGSREHAMLSWRKFMTNFPIESSRSNAGSNLWALYYLRMMDLQEKEDWPSIVELHEEVWDDDLIAFALDPKVFRHVTKAYLMLGFEDEASKVARKLGTIQNPYLTEEERARNLLTTAKIYKSMPGHSVDGLSTLETIETKNISARMRNEADLLRVELLHEQDNYKDTIPILRRLKQSRRFRAQASLMKSYAHSKLGNCSASVAELQKDVLTNPALTDILEPIYLFSISRCLQEAGRSNKAVAFLERSKEFELNKREIARVNYLISEYTGKLELASQGSPEEKIIWNKLLREKSLNNEFKSEYEEWLKNSK
ncbi:MAG: hypothetical protein VX278_07285 [Myxococcota bacterium]|nr:hypothetical protein [Myxococcota bacterium]